MHIHGDAGTENRCPAIVLRIIENMPPTVTHFVDEQQNGVEIPESIVQVLRGRNNNDRFLPEEGHFLVEAEIRAKINKNRHLSTFTMVNVQLSCYRHSARGAKAIEKIRSSLNGEVCRTNRKWRKIRQRQNQT